jgi:hypothetical protein
MNEVSLMAPAVDLGQNSTTNSGSDFAPLFGLHLGNVFAPNHKGMKMPQSTSRWEHLEKPLGIGLRAKRCDSNA